MKGLKFLKSVIGEPGSAALIKAVERQPSISNIVIPRAIFSWINNVESFQGSIPGTNDKIIFNKGPKGYTGKVEIGKNLYKFEDSTIFNVLGAITVSLELNPGIDTNYNNLANLGKNIDLLVKSHIKRSSVSDIRKRALGKVQKATDDPAASKVGFAQHGKAHEPAQPLGFAPPVSVQPEQKKASGNSLVVKSCQLDIRCEVCSMKFFKNEEFKGCFCLKEIAHNTKLTKSDESYVLELGKKWDSENVAFIKRFFE